MAEKKKQPSLMKKDAAEVVEWLSTGSTLLDAAASCYKSPAGGFPTRRIIEFSGTGGAGKSYICGEMAGDALRKGYEVYVDDIERRWDLDRLSTFGFDWDTPGFHYIDPSSYIEECFERMMGVFGAAKAGAKILYIVDPVAALNSKREIDGKSDKMGQSRAKAVQQKMRLLKEFIGSSNHTFCVIFSNQLIDNVNAGLFEEKKITPLGNAMIHWPAVRVRFSQIGKLTDNLSGRTGTKADKKKVQGIKLKAVFKKNSEDDPFREVEFSIVLGNYGVDNIRDCARWLKTYTDALGTDAAWYEWPLKNGDPIRVNGLPAFVDWVEKHNREAKLFKKCFTHYKRWHKPVIRKEKVRI